LKFATQKPTINVGIEIKATENNEPKTCKIKKRNTKFGFRLFDCEKENKIK